MLKISANVSAIMYVYNYIGLDIFAVRGRMTAMYFGRIADSLNFRGGSARMPNAGNINIKR